MLYDLGDRPFYREMIRHNAFDDFWRSYSMKGKYGEVAVPAYFMTGWYDNLLHEGFKVFSGWKGQAHAVEARTQTRLLVARTHGTLGSAVAFGDIQFGPGAALDLAGEHLRWYDQRLKGDQNGIDDEPAVRLFVMGSNVWRGEHEWPLARTRYTKYFLRSGGRANSLFGDGALSLDAPAERAGGLVYLRSG